jgi:chromosome segregation ATPase
MNASDRRDKEWRIQCDAWRERFYKAEADLEAAELHSRNVEAQLETVTQARDVIRAYWSAEGKRADKTEADRAAISKEWNDWASSHSAWIAEKAVLLAERDALQSELADYKESWERIFEVPYVFWDPAINARIRARRGKEAGKCAET